MILKSNPYSIYNIFYFLISLYLIYEEVYLTTP